MISSRLHPTTAASALLIAGGRFPRLIDRLGSRVIDGVQLQLRELRYLIWAPAAPSSRFLTEGLHHLSLDERCLTPCVQ